MGWLVDMQNTHTRTYSHSTAMWKDQRLSLSLRQSETGRVLEEVVSAVHTVVKGWLFNDAWSQ